MGVVDAIDLAKSFGERRVLSGLTFSVERGEVYGLVGPNGAGKTTTINILCGLLTPDGGRVSLRGHPLRHRAGRHVGIATQEVALYRDLTCRQNLAFFATLYGLRGPLRAERVGECLRAVALEGRASTLASRLSGGMQRRLHVAIAMLHRPELLILDEPTVGLDLESRQRTWDLIRSLARGGGGVLVTTHQLEEAEALCDRIGILHAGGLVAEGTMTELRRRIPAAELAVIEADDLDAVCRRAAELELTYRRSLTAVTAWLPERDALETVAGKFRGIALRSLTLRPVGLGEIFAEATGTAGPSPLA